MPHDPVTRQHNSRSRRKAAGGSTLSCVLSRDATDALEHLLGKTPGVTKLRVVEQALRRAAVAVGWKETLDGR